MDLILAAAELGLILGLWIYIGLDHHAKTLARAMGARGFTNKEE